MKQRKVDRRVLVTCLAILSFLKRNNLDPDKDVVLRAIGGTPLRAAALERGMIAAAPFSPEDAVSLLKKGFPMIINLSESLNIPQSLIVTRGEVLEKYPETTKRFLKALILGIHLARSNKKEAIKAGYDAGLKGDPDTVSKRRTISMSLLSPLISRLPWTASRL